MARSATTPDWENMNYVIILAGGKGVRMNSAGTPKQFIKLGGVPMLVYSLRTAQRNRNVDRICVVAPPAAHDDAMRWGKEHGIDKLRYFAEAGKERFQSVYNGIMSIPAERHDHDSSVPLRLPGHDGQALRAHSAILTRPTKM